MSVEQLHAQLRQIQGVVTENQEFNQQAETHHDDAIKLGETTVDTLDVAAEGIAKAIAKTDAIGETTGGAATELDNTIGKLRDIMGTVGSIGTALGEDIAFVTGARDNGTRQAQKVQPQFTDKIGETIGAVSEAGEKIDTTKELLVKLDPTNATENSNLIRIRSAELPALETVEGEYKSALEDATRTVEGDLEKIGGIDSQLGETITDLNGNVETVESVKERMHNVIAGLEEDLKTLRALQGSLGETSESLTEDGSQVDEVKDTTKQAGGILANTKGKPHVLVGLAETVKESAQLYIDET